MSFQWQTTLDKRPRSNHIIESVLLIEEIVGHVLVQMAFTGGHLWLRRVGGLSKAHRQTKEKERKE